MSAPAEATLLQQVCDGAPTLTLIQLVRHNKLLARKRRAALVVIRADARLRVKIPTGTGTALCAGIDPGAIFRAGRRTLRVH